ncbi:MAG TPA: hypothetical protein VE987_10975 [Polyangiaceae bacterium]|nr:hypothetical protein [Polyangiaceae bacterium]
MRTAFVMIVAACPWLCACSDQGGREGPPDATSDASSDASSDAAPDSASDTAPGIAPDAGDAGTDAADAAGACATCADTLEQACDGGLDCPPSLGSAAFFRWAARQIGSTSGGVGPWRPPSCIAMADCPEDVTVIFGAGVDCDHEFVFAAATGQLLAVTNTCNGLALGTCAAATGCVPNRCLPIGHGGQTTSPATCPALPDAGLADAAAE